MLIHPRHHRQETELLSTDLAMRIERIAKRDAELACAMAQSLLRPCEKPGEFREVSERFDRAANEILYGPEDRDISRLRKAYGLAVD